MGTTTNENIFYPNSDSVDGYQSDMSTMASSVDTAFSTRAFRTYRWANIAARNAQPGVQNGDEGYQSDTAFFYRYSTGQWYKWAQIQTSYTPTTTGFTTPLSALYYSTSGGITTIQGEFVISGVTGAMSFTLPTNNPISSNYYTTDRLGSATFHDVGTNDYDGFVSRASSTTVSLRTWNVGSTYPASAAISSTVPFTWVGFDLISVNFSYHVQNA